MEVDKPYKVSVNSLQGIPEPGDTIVEVEDKTEVLILSILIGVFFGAGIIILIIWWIQWRRRSGGGLAAAGGRGGGAYGAAGGARYDAASGQVTLGGAHGGEGVHQRHVSQPPAGGAGAGPGAGPSGASGGAAGGAVGGAEAVPGRTRSTDSGKKSSARKTSKDSGKKS